MVLKHVSFDLVRVFPLHPLMLWVEVLYKGETAPNKFELKSNALPPHHEQS